MILVVASILLPCSLIFFTVALIDLAITLLILAGALIFNAFILIFREIEFVNIINISITIFINCIYLFVKY